MWQAATKHDKIDARIRGVVTAKAEISLDALQDRIDKHRKAGQPRQARVLEKLLRKIEDVKARNLLRQRCNPETETR